MYICIKLKTMIEISKGSNQNYLAKIVELKGIRKHTNADKLACISIDFQNVIIGLQAKEGDIYVYFPVECKINLDFLRFTNSFRDFTENADYKNSNNDRKMYLSLEENKKERVVGFFDENGRVKTMKLREEKSMGYLVPANEVEAFLGLNKGDLTQYAGQEFDTINGTLMCEKYVPKVSKQPGSGKGKDKQGMVAKVSKVIEGQQHFHISTSNLRKNIHKIFPSTLISITYKTHGTSVWASNVLIKKQMTWKERLAKWFGVDVYDTEYGVLYGSRKVVKNKHFEDPNASNHFYKGDIWDIATRDFRNDLPKGFSVYGEILGYTPSGSAIQGGYDYGCLPGEHKLEIYIVTHTNPDGLVTELSFPQICNFCERLNLTPSIPFYTGYADQFLFSQKVSYTGDDFQEIFLQTLEKLYNEKDCFMCNNAVPEEGVVVREESLFSCDSYKLKSFRFLNRESEELDKGVADIESEN